MEAGDKWGKLEEIVRRVLREELKAHGHQVVEQIKQLSLFGRKAKIELVNGKWIGITEEQREAWSAAYGALDLDAELKKAAAWCVSNPHLSPKSQIGRFLNTWLAKGQNAASLRSIPTERPTEVKQKLCGYCSNPHTGSVNGIPYCNDHSLDAMDMKPRRMLGVVAKPVAGRD